MQPKLLTRDEFRTRVFARDGNKCVFCTKPAVDAHHVLERRLWPDGGYYLDNGASVCEEHHMQCEMTTISVEDVRHACGITKIVVPPHLYHDQSYDKWGNPVLTSGRRARGELFFDESVQKVLGMGNVLGEFTSYIKYPRSHHVSWSPGVNDDDRVIQDMSAFEGQRVIVTEKMDGENTTMYADYIHARSVDGRSHSSRDWVKGFWSSIAHDIPPDWRICGENLYAKHSVGYDDLTTYFMGFSIWNERNVCLDWDTTLEWFELLGITPVPILYDGVYDEKTIKSLWSEKDWGTREGYVVRTADEIGYGEFKKKLGKFVRANHVQTSKHWFHGQVIEKNGLCTS